MPEIITPVRLDRLQSTLISVLDEATGLTCSWGQTHRQRGDTSGAFVSCEIVNGPGAFVRNRARGRTLRAISTVDLTVGAPTVGGRVGFYLNSHLYYHDVVLADTPSTVRDALVALVGADEYETASAAAGAPGVLTLTADFLGGIRQLSVLSGIDAGTPTYGGNVLVAEGTQTILVSIGCFSKSRSPRNGAHSIAAAALAGLQSTDLTLRFAAEGIGVRGKSQPRDLGVIAGGRWESRVSFDVEFALASVWTRPADIIESLTTSIVVKDETGATVASATDTTEV